MIFSDFPSRVRIGYVLREGGSYSYIVRHTLDEAALSLDELHAAAIENLRALPSPGIFVAQTPGGPEAWLSDTVDNFNAARLLLPNLQKELLSELGDPFLAIFPCRDWHVCWSMKQEAEWQTKNMSEALRIFREDDYNLTPDVLEFSNGKFSLKLAQVP